MFYLFVVLKNGGCYAICLGKTSLKDTQATRWILKRRSHACQEGRLVAGSWAPVSERTICVTQTVGRELKCFLNPQQPVLLEQSKRYTTRDASRCFGRTAFLCSSPAFGKSSTRLTLVQQEKHQTRGETPLSSCGCSKVPLYRQNTARLHKMTIFTHILLSVAILTLSDRSQILAVPSLLAEINMSFEG